MIRFGLGNHLISKQSSHDNCKGYLVLLELMELLQMIFVGFSSHQTLQLDGTTTQGHVQFIKY